MGTNAGHESLIVQPELVLWFHFPFETALFGTAIFVATTCIDCPDSANRLFSLISSMLTMTVIIEYRPAHVRDTKL